jgi:serine protease Do
MLEVPERVKVALALSDGVGNVLDPKLDGPKVKSAGGKAILQQRDRLTDKEASDAVRKGCFHKVHVVKLTAGTTYTIDLESVHIDAYLRLEDPDGKQVAEDDDGGGNLNSRIVYTAPADGEYRIVVTTCDPEQTGNYRLSVLQADKGEKTGDAPPREALPR